MLMSKKMLLVLLLINLYLLSSIMSSSVNRNFLTQFLNLIHYISYTTIFICEVELYFVLYFISYCIAFYPLQQTHQLKLIVIVVVTWLCAFTQNIIRNPKKREKTRQVLVLDKYLEFQVKYTHKKKNKKMVVGVIMKGLPRRIYVR